tara:strand:- start:1688 stop:2080 length:393 start_codon:yes stop_codon:yes gene_type:complete
MIEKALIIIIFMYALNFSMLGIQFMYADVVGHEMVNHEGVPITSNIQNYINISQLNTTSTNVTGMTSSAVISNPLTAAAEIAWELFLLLTGTYIFSVIHLLGVPSIIVAGMVILYIIMLSRTIIGYLRGI